MRRRPVHGCRPAGVVKVAGSTSCDVNAMDDATGPFVNLQDQPSALRLARSIPPTLKDERGDAPLIRKALLVFGERGGLGGRKWRRWRGLASAVLACARAMVIKSTTTAKTKRFGLASIVREMRSCA